MDPGSILAAWAAGLCAGAALVASWRIVGPGFVRLALGVAFGLAASAALAHGGFQFWLGAAFAVIGVLLAGWVLASTALGATAALILGIAAFDGVGGPLRALTVVLLLGGVSTEMLLGHWYLVDPRLPRASLQRLAAIGIAGAVADAIALSFAGDALFGQGIAAAGWGVLAGTTVLLMVAVWYALREAGYPAVMAATGLSYLAVLTALGMAVVGRAIALAG